MTTDDELDLLLSSAEQEILPSFGFTRSVMEAVQSEASMPAPIPFPWKHALPGLAAAAFALAWILVVAFTQLASGSAAPPLALTPPPALIPILEAGGWSLLAMLLAFASVKLSMRLVSGSA
jgi:hypothetical protein